MWGYKLVCANGTTLYYDSNEYDIALLDMLKYGGIIYNNHGKKMKEIGVTKNEWE